MPVPKAIHLTPSQIVDRVMELDLSSDLQTSIFRLAKSVESANLQNRFLLTMCISLMAEFDRASSQAIIDGTTKVAINLDTVKLVTDRVGASKERPVVCYDEKDSEGFLRLEWKPLE